MKKKIFLLSMLLLVFSATTWSQKDQYQKLDLPDNFGHIFENDKDLDRRLADFHELYGVEIVCHTSAPQRDNWHASEQVNRSLAKQWNLSSRNNANWVIIHVSQKGDEASVEITTGAGLDNYFTNSYQLTSIIDKHLDLLRIGKETRDYREVLSEMAGDVMRQYKEKRDQELKEQHLVEENARKHALKMQVRAEKESEFTSLVKEFSNSNPLNTALEYQQKTGILVYTFIIHKPAGYYGYDIQEIADYLVSTVIGDRKVVLISTGFDFNPELAIAGTPDVARFLRGFDSNKYANFISTNWGNSPGKDLEKMNNLMFLALRSDLGDYSFWYRSYYWLVWLMILLVASFLVWRIIILRSKHKIVLDTENKVIDLFNLLDQAEEKVVHYIDFSEETPKWAKEKSMRLLLEAMPVLEELKDLHANASTINPNDVTSYIKAVFLFGLTQKANEYANQGLMKARELEEKITDLKNLSIIITLYRDNAELEKMLALEKLDKFLDLISSEIGQHFNWMSLFNEASALKYRLELTTINSNEDYRTMYLAVKDVNKGLGELIQKYDTYKLAFFNASEHCKKVEQEIASLESHFASFKSQLKLLEKEYADTAYQDIISLYDRLGNEQMIFLLNNQLTAVRDLITLDDENDGNCYLQAESLAKHLNEDVYLVKSMFNLAKARKAEQEEAKRSYMVVKKSANKQLAKSAKLVKHSKVGNEARNLVGEARKVILLAEMVESHKLPDWILALEKLKSAKDNALEAIKQADEDILNWTALKQENFTSYHHSNSGGNSGGINIEGGGFSGGRRF